MSTVAINGLGRIGRAALEILLDADGLNVVAVSDIADASNLAYLIKRTEPPCCSARTS